ncbi:hypothetical protein [Mesorhizobium retamae]|uniref:Uncharacterized protein n=1 Tax=Mesorhizobium retamae TaxID=2912854 RepID=A0ABS9QC76_9HYPH|nr:hypothetical protein [Mesorhizobium sp. IRAMC:0171]MCG7505014.1 hypothetical protein [Mesorhizobium sp. IRAMC:0171]
MKLKFATVVLGFAMATAVTLPTNAQSLQPVRPGVNSIGQADLQALRNQLQRQQFQQQQQIYREIDRQNITPPQTVAPAVRQPCQSSANGGNAVGGCR